MQKKIFLFFYFGIIFLAGGCVTVPRPVIPPSVGPAGVGGVYHIVGSGQTLWRIARTYGVPMQEIMRRNQIADPNQLGVGQELFIPGAKTPLSVEKYKTSVPLAIAQVVGPKHYSSRWRSITIHHSATLEGDAEAFDRNHRRRGMGGLFYHFVIGNGTASGDGEIEVGWRWRKQNQVNRKQDIQVCLVGDFNRQKVYPAQFESLLSLINVLRRQYNIPLRNIRRHKDVSRKATDCPGRNFPFRRLILELKQYPA